MPSTAPTPHDTPPAADLVITGIDVLAAPGDLRTAVDIAISGGVIVAIKPAPSAARVGAAATLDGTGLLAVPGLVNAHTHSAENPMRGLADGLALEP